jgi:Uma2 family endonuclease
VATRDANISGVQTPAPGARYRWADFIALEEDDLRELIDGELLELEVPTKAHERIVMDIGYLLRSWSEEHGGLVLGSGYKVRITDRRGVMPDVQFFCKGHENVGGEQGLEEGAPDLAVEVVSPSSRRYDRVVKLHYYAHIGVPEYWLIDPEARTIERLVLEAGGYRIAEARGDEGVFAPPSFPGLSVDLAKLFAP